MPPNPHREHQFANRAHADGARAEMVTDRGRMGRVQDGQCLPAARVSSPR
jgi:hypothetical protein